MRELEARSRSIPVFFLTVETPADRNACIWLKDGQDPRRSISVAPASPAASESFKESTHFRHRVTGSRVDKRSLSHS